MYIMLEGDAITTLAFGLVGAVGVLLGVVMAEMLGRRQRRRDREGTMDRLRLLQRTIRYEAAGSHPHSVYQGGDPASNKESLQAVLYQLESVMEWIRYREQRDRTGADLADMELIDVPFTNATL